jgi:hypothetical protein
MIFEERRNIINDDTRILKPQICYNHRNEGKPANITISHTGLY